jgi:hypothetical protein
MICIKSLNLDRSLYVYRFVSLLSLLFRTYIFSNPFEKYIELALNGTIIRNCSSQLAYIFNLSIGSTILWAICYPLTGIVYKRGEYPVLGAIIFFILVLINSWVLEIIGLYMYNIITGLIIFFVTVIAEAVVLMGINHKIRF